LRSVLRRHALACDVAVNSNWAHGLAGSLKIGIARLDSSVQGALILLVDQPLIGASDLNRLAAYWHRRPAHPAAASYQGHIGAPAVIPRRLFGASGQLQGDVGARHLLRSLGQLTAVAMPRAAVDIDTPADALALTRRQSGET
jgi:molybdenum cofactor cytidylyltransferase